jgi:hypothetical protein
MVAALRRPSLHVAGFALAIRFPVARLIAGWHAMQVIRNA